MHTGYDNYWMFNRQDSLLNLPKNDNLSHGVALDSYKQIQDGRQTSHLNSFLSARNNRTNTNQNILGDPQRTSQCVWTSSVYARPSRPYNYQSGGCMLQKDSRAYWQNLGPRSLDNRNDVAPLNNNNISQKTSHLETSINNSTTRSARIRVRDVNSLNNIAQNSMPNNGIRQSQFDCYLNCGYNINQRQQNVAEKNVEHANYIPSLFEVNPFQPPTQRPTTAPHPTISQDQFANSYQKQRFLPGGPYHMNNITRNEPPGKPTSHSLLQELLSFKENQMDVLRPPEPPQNVQTVNSRLSVPSSTTKESDLSLSCLLRDSYSLGQSSYGNPPPYSESVQRREVSSVSQGSSAPLIEPISPPLVQNNPTQSNKPILVTAVISLPDLSNKTVTNQSSAPCNPNFTTVTQSTNNVPQNSEPEMSPNTCVPNDSVNDCLKVKDEPLFPSEFLNDTSTLEIVIQTMKTENFQEQDEGTQNTEQTNNNEGNIPDVDKFKNSSVDNTEKSNLSATETTNTPKKDSSDTKETKLEATESNYKSKINRDKLDRLIEFLNGDDKHGDYVSEQISEKAKKQKKMDGTSKPNLNKPSAEKSKNAGKDITSVMSHKVARIEITRCSSQPLQTVKNDESGKKIQNKSKNEEQNPTLEKQSGENGNAEKPKPKNDTKKHTSDNHITDPKSVQETKTTEKSEMKHEDVKKKKPKKMAKTKSVSTECQTQVTMIIENSEIAEKTKSLEISKQTEKCTEEESRLQADQVGSSPMCDINQNENPTGNQTKVLKSELRILSDALSPVSLEQVLQNNISQAQKSTEGAGKTNFVRIFPNFNYHFCKSCNLVSPIEWFWINAVSGELKCLNCFKRMNLDSVETTHNLSFGDGNDPETASNSTENIHSPSSRNSTCSDSEKQTKVVNRLNRISSEGPDDKRRQSNGREECQKDKSKSLEENVLHDKKEKRRKSIEKSEKKTQEQMSEGCTIKSARQNVSECSRTEKTLRKSLSNDGSQSPRIEERVRKNSDQIRKSLSKDEDTALKGGRKTEGGANSDGTKKRVNSKEDYWPRKIRVVEESEEEYTESYMQKSVKLYEKLKKLKEANAQRGKGDDQEEMKRKSISKDSRIKSPVDREKKQADDKKINPKENENSKSLSVPSEQEKATKPLKEKQNTKVQSPSYGKPQEERKKLEKKIMKWMMEDRDRKKREEGERKNATIKGPLQYKDFVLSKSPKSCFPDMMEDFPLRKIRKEVDVMKRNECNGKDDEKSAKLFAKLKKKTKKLSLNLLKNT